MPSISLLRAARLACIGAAFAAPAFAQSPTLDAVRQRGMFNCGVSPNLPGFSAPDSRGVMQGLEADSCRAIAVALFGDPDKVRFVPTTVQNRFTALQSGEVDVLIRNTTWTLSREGSLGLMFAPANFYDGQGFIVKKSAGVASAKELNGAAICVQPGSTTELNLQDYFRSNNMTFTPVVIADTEEIFKAFIAGRCDAYTTDASSLASFRARQGANAEQYVILPELISKEPLAPAVRKGDDRWFDIVRWSFFAQLIAEELGINSQNIDSFMTSQNPEVRRFLGLEGNMGKPLGLDDRWAYNIIKKVGNFAEMWDRTMGAMGVQRGINNLWNKGGIQYAPPMR